MLALTNVEAIILWVLGGTIALVIAVCVWLWMRDVWNEPITTRLDALLRETAATRAAIEKAGAPPPSSGD